MSAQRGVLDAERDARTIYDIACIREQRSDATREDVEFKEIALRNLNTIAAVAELVEADKEYDAANEGYHHTTATPEQIERLAHATLRRRKALARMDPQPGEEQ